MIVKRTLRRACLASIAALGFQLGVLAAENAPTSTNAPTAGDFLAQSLSSARVLQQWYNEKGLWDSTGWWNAANCLEAIESVIDLTNGEQHLEVIRKTFDAHAAGKFLNEYYDDEGWWALAWIRAFDLTGERRYLNMGKTIFADMKTGWDEHCRGGIWWKKDRRYKNAIANELFLLTAIRLHQRTPGDEGQGSYLEWAQREWAWFKQSGMINDQSLVNDGLTAECANNRRTTWSYNQGVIIGGLTEMYLSTGDTNLLNQAMTIANAAIGTLVDENGILREPNEARGLRGADSPQFKGIFIRHLAELSDVTGEARYRDFLIRNARSVWQYNLDASNRFGGRWSGPVDSVDAARHSSAMRVITAVAEPAIPPTTQTRHWAAADLIHDLGQPVRNNQWSAHPLANRDSGFLSRLILTNMPAGDHVAGFQLKVDNFIYDQEAVATLSVFNVGTQQVEAQRTIKRGEFHNVRYHTFPLSFTVRPNQNYELRTYWHYTRTAPRLTQLSLSLSHSGSK